MRTTFLCMIAGSLAQALPPGCTPETADPTQSQRGTIATSASVNVASVGVGEVVELSADAGGAGSATTFHWVQVAGPGVRLQGDREATARFFAPSLGAGQTLRFRVATRNEAGDVGGAEVEVVVAADPNYNSGDGGSGGSGGDASAPVARAGNDQSVASGATVTLDGTRSTGIDLSYEWQQMSGVEVSIGDPARGKVNFKAPTVSSTQAQTVLEFQLTVTDGRGRSDRDRVRISVLPSGSSGETPGTAPPQVVFVTNFGTFTVELFPEEAPKSVANFLRYVDEDFYDGTIFHRVIPGFVVQGGGFGVGLVQKDTHDPVENESDNGLSNERATLAMARTSDPDSATSQFYVNLADNDSLDATNGADGYTVFGKVISGMSTIDAIAGLATETRNGFNDVPVQDVVVTSATRVTGSSESGLTP